MKITNEYPATKLTSLIYILIPIYNEEKSIPLLYQELTSVSYPEDVKYVFSDDGSSDQSIKLLHQFFANTNYIILGDGNNYGPGHAFNVGFEWILTQNLKELDVVITMEADTTSDISLLNKMLQISNMGYSLVLASVYAQSGGFDKTSFFRKFVSFVANMLFRSFFNIKVLTLSSFYRVYHVSLLQKIQKKYNTLITEYGFTCMLEILIKAIDCNANVIEVPMVLKSQKRQGKSKMKILKTTRAYALFFMRWKFFSNTFKKRN